MSEQFQGMETVVGGAIFLALMVGVFYLYRFLIMKRRRVLIGAAMESYGITPADAAAAGLESDVYKASQRCADCPSTGPCRNWLVFGQKKRLEQNCPNLELFRAVRSHKKSRDTEEYC